MTTAQYSTPATSRDDLDVLLGRVEEELAAFLTGEQVRRAEPDVRGALPVQAIAALAKAGGKRLRPAFCLTGYLAAGGPPADEPVRAAVALELLHIAALIHDDVMDDADTRRGTPTVHSAHAQAHRHCRWRGEARRYGEAIAVLAGDLAWVYADRFMADLPADVTREWFELKAELVVGQSLDVRAAAEPALDPVLARHIAILKSGRYTIHRPLVLGATLAGRPDLAPAFETYGEALGEAFQLRDDVIDAFGDGTASGKPAGLDFARQKMTLLVALATRHDERARALAERGAFAELHGHIVTSGVRAIVEEHIDALVRTAREAIDDAPISAEWRAMLSRMAVKVAYRDS